MSMPASDRPAGLVESAAAEDGNEPNQDPFPAKELPRGLDSYVFFGFSVLDWKFRPRIIFRPTYKNQDPSGTGEGWIKLQDSHLNQDVKIFSVPDGITIKGSRTYRKTEAEIFRGTHNLNENNYAVSVESSIGLEGVFSSDIGTSLALSSSVTVNTEQSTALVAVVKVVYEVDINDPPELSRNFQEALSKLPETYAEDTKAIFADFFNIWGTHYLRRGVFGGTYNMRTVLSAQDTQRIDTSEFKAKIEASYNDGVDSGKTKMEIERRTRQELGTSDRSTDIQIFEVGGDPDDTPKEWADSVVNAPVLLFNLVAVTTDEFRPKFAPIYDLGINPRQSATLQTALLDYLSGRRLFGPAKDRPINETWGPLGTNGFYILSTAGAQDTSRTTLRLKVREKEAADSPVTNYAGAVGIIDNGLGSHLGHASLIVPVARGCYIDQQAVRAVGSAALNAAFMETELSLGAWQDLPPFFLKGMGFLLHAETDGFLMLNLRCERQNELRAEMWLGANNKHFIGCTAVPSPGPNAVSLCMPVPKGTQLYYTNHSQTEVVPKKKYEPSFAGEFKWMPVLSSKWKFEPMVRQRDLKIEPGGNRVSEVSFSPNDNSQFIFGFVGGRPLREVCGTLEIWDEKESGQSGRCYAAASCDHRLQVLGNPVMMPVHHGHKWKARLTDSGGRGLTATLFSVSVTEVGR